MTAILRWSRRSKRTNRARSGFTGRTSTTSTPAWRRRSTASAAQERPAAQGIHQHGAGDAAPRGPCQRDDEVIDEAARVPDVELQAYRATGGVDVGDERAHDRRAVGQQLEAVAVHRWQSDGGAGQPADAFGTRGERLRVADAGCRNALGPAQYLGMQRGRSPHPGSSQPPLADQEIGQRSDRGQQDDQQQPRHGGSAGAAPREDAQRDAGQHEEVEKGKQDKHGQLQYRLPDRPRSMVRTAGSRHHAPGCGRRLKLKRSGTLTAAIRCSGMSCQRTGEPSLPAHQFEQGVIVGDSRRSRPRGIRRRIARGRGRRASRCRGSACSRMLPPSSR